MSGYTAGPWKWWTSNSFLRLSSETVGKDGGVIDSYVMRDGHSTLKVSQGDMALIAAAPELLEACLRMRNQLYAAGYEAEAGSVHPPSACWLKLKQQSPRHWASNH